MLRLTLIHISNRGPWWLDAQWRLWYGYTWHLDKNAHIFITLGQSARRWTCSCLTRWGRVTHIWGRQATIWRSVGILLIGPSWTNFSEILIEIHTFLFKRMHLKTSSAKCRPFCLSLNVLIITFWYLVDTISPTNSFNLNDRRRQIIRYL